ncbi:MAG: LamG domain-containing protein, partial [Planctomycetaceae bacterium]|nr:LamG domain-containing protein [Planctomycetaceae bacterium]
MDLGRHINPEPCPDPLILGALSMLLNNDDFMVTQLANEKPFNYTPFFMKTNYRFIEGYQGNDTVRGWREYDSIYHSVFACVRGTDGYPKGDPWNTVPEGLLLRPAIPSAELFQVESTYGPKANFKISLRELPDTGKFRVTINAARYEDALLLEPDAPHRAAAKESSGQVVINNPQNVQEVTIPRGGIYQVDVFPRQPEAIQVPPDATRLDEQLVGHWTFDNTTAALDRPEALAGDAHFVESPFQRALSLDGDNDAFVAPRDASMDVGDGDFTVAAWINPRELRQSGIFCLGKYSWTHGWYFDMPNNQGVLRIETVGPNNSPNGTVASRVGAIRVNRWQHVAAVVRRGENETRLFVNGYQVATGAIGKEVLDNPKVSLYIGRIQDAQQFKGEIDEVYFYRRALDEAEL